MRCVDRLGRTKAADNASAAIRSLVQGHYRIGVFKPLNALPGLAGPRRQCHSHRCSRHLETGPSSREVGKILPLAVDLKADGAARQCGEKTDPAVFST